MHHFFESTFSLFKIHHSPYDFICFTKPKSLTLYYKDYSLDFLTGKKSPLTLDDIDKKISQIQMNGHLSNPCVVHLSYEWGYYYQDLHELIPHEAPLAIIIFYEKYQFLHFSDLFKQGERFLQTVSLKKHSGVDFSHYKRTFQDGYEHLLNGDFYQFNLTYPSYYKISSQVNPWGLILNLWKKTNHRSAYAHATYIKNFNFLLLSNSPECLFHVKKEKKHFLISSSPIKGSMKLERFYELEKKWKELCGCRKNEGELFMITDLIRNDLNRIEKPIAQIVEKKAPLLVPGILHQYSKVEVKVSKNIKLNQILKALFPGGSVTGAPKKNTMHILSHLEKTARGFYTGSTILLHGNLISSSINIRTAIVDFKKELMTYAAGGGITLKSQVEEEFIEMELKEKSFIKLIGLGARSNNQAYISL